MIKLEFNGKPFNPKTFEEQILHAAMKAVADEMHERVSAIRHPITGEFPTVVVQGTSLDDMAMHIEGSPELLQIVSERIGVTAASEVDVVHPADKNAPKVFLSWTENDRALAESIANSLMRNGIDTWWSDWCINAGDSLRRKIDEGLRDCTHFVVLLTPQSIDKPWVNQEIDAAFSLMLSEKKVKFIGLRNGLRVNQLPPLMQGLLSPEVVGPNYDLTNLVNDIYGISKKPSRGSPPVVVGVAQQSGAGYSAAATAIAKVFSDRTTHAYYGDPSITVEELARDLVLTEEDVADALHELRALVKENFGHVRAEPELFAIFDKYWREWSPADDALKLAVDLIQAEGFPSQVAEIASIYGWDARRMNPALAYLMSRRLVFASEALGTMPWLTHWIQKTDETRRFVRSKLT